MARKRGRRSRRNAGTMMARANRSSYANPAFSVDRLQRVAVSAAAVGSVTAATMILTNMALDKLAPTWQLPARAATKIGSGILLGTAVGGFNGPEAVAAGLAIGGVAGGVNDLYQRYVAPRLLPAAGLPYAPPAAAGLPGGMPAGYEAVTAANRYAYAR